MDENLSLFSYLYSAPLVQQVDNVLKEVDLLDYVNEKRGYFLFYLLFIYF